jgi:hypothetical protein
MCAYFAFELGEKLKGRDITHGWLSKPGKGEVCGGLGLSDDFHYGNGFGIVLLLKRHVCRELGLIRSWLEQIAFGGVRYVMQRRAWRIDSVELALKQYKTH